MQTVTLLKNDFKKEESRNIDREITLEIKIKQLDNMVYKRDQSAQTVHMLTKPQFFYDHTTKQALDFQNPFYLKKAQQLELKVYDDPSPSCRPTKVEVPKELPKVSMVNTSLKKLKHHLAGFDVVVKERTTTKAITEGLWGFEHIKDCFRDEIIPFVKALKDIFNTFDQYLIDKLTEVQNVFHQMRQKSRMELYMMNRQHGQMILESVEHGPLIWPTIEENRVTRPRKYSELTPVKQSSNHQGTLGKNSTSHARIFIDEIGKIV
nr:hypothetical protein [Tanacetum cinerariifolium]